MNGLERLIRDATPILEVSAQPVSTPAVALRLHAKRCRRAWTKRLWARIRGTYRCLEDLATIMEHSTLTACYDMGAHSVPLKRIIGSEGRSSNYDRDWCPLSYHECQRWRRVAQAYLEHIPLPAVELIEIKGAYYVRDGHNRVSVANALGQVSIDAKVTHYDIEPLALSWDLDDPTLTMEVASLPKVPPKLWRPAA